MLYQFSLLLVASWFFFSVFRLRWRRSKKSPVDHPPAVPGLPVFGNLHQLGSLPHRTLRALAEKHGPVMVVRLGRVPTVVVSSPEGAQEVLKTRDLVFASRPDSSLADRLFYRSQEMAFSKYGEQWRQMRRIGVLHLLSQKQVHSFRRVREEEAAALVGRIRAAGGGPVNLSDMIVDFTNDLICRVALGQTYADAKGGGSQLRALFGELSELMGLFPLRDYIPWLGWIDWLSGLDGRARKIGLKLDALLEKVIVEHRRRKFADKIDANDMDLVDILLTLGDRNDDDASSSTNISLTMENIKGLILDMIVAGTDTTKATIEWAMVELIRHPEEMAKVQEEIRRGDQEIREEALERMEQLKAVLKETLRLHPPGPLLLPRESRETTELQGYCIPKGTRVVVNGWAIARDPSLWDKAEEFLPERFLGVSGTALDFKGSDFRYLPFGAGRRGCPGIGFSMVSLEVVLASLLYYFDWEMPGGMSSDEMDMEEVFGIIMQKKSSVILQGRPSFKVSTVLL